MRADRIVKGLLRTRFVITTKQGATWDGVLMSADANTLVLLDVEAVSPDGTRTKADGQVLIPRGDVAYYQKP